MNIFKKYSSFQLQLAFTFSIFSIALNNSYAQSPQEQNSTFNSTGIVFKIKSIFSRGRNGIHYQYQYQLKTNQNENITLALGPDFQTIFYNEDNSLNSLTHRKVELTGIKLPELSANEPNHQPVKTSKAVLLSVIVHEEPTLTGKVSHYYFNAPGELIGLGETRITLEDGRKINLIKNLSQISFKHLKNSSCTLQGTFNLKHANTYSVDHLNCNTQ